MQWIVHESKNAIAFDEINQLTESVGWGKQYHRSAEIWQRVLSASSHVAHIRDNNKLIAFGRILEDGIMCMFYDICIHPEYHGKNIGTLLMNHLISKVNGRDYVSMGLFCWDGNISVSEFYEKLGFKKSLAMELKK